MLAAVDKYMEVFLENIIMPKRGSDIIAIIDALLFRERVHDQ